MAFRIGEECPICCQVRERLLKLTPCHHNLCEGCIAKLDSFALHSATGRRCPYCRQEFEVVHSPHGLVQLCFRKLRGMRLEIPDIKRLPPEVRSMALNHNSNARLLYGDRLVELLRGLSLETLSLCDAENMKPEDLEAAMPLLASPPKTVLLSRVPQLNDRALRAVLAASKAKLEHLDASAASEHLSGSSLKEFARSLPRLAHLNLAECGGMETECVVPLITALASSLRILNLSGCRRLDKEAITSISMCHGLRQLSLFGLWKLDAATIIPVLASCSQLQALDVTRCGRIHGPELLRAVARYCTELRELRVGAVPEIGDEEVSTLVVSTAGAGLRALSLADTEISKVALMAIEKSCPELVQLDISWCHDLSENAVVDMISFMPQLKVLNCRGCRSISNQAMFFIAQVVSGRALGVEEPRPLKGARGQASVSSLPPLKAGAGASRSSGVASAASRSGLSSRGGDDGETGPGRGSTGSGSAGGSTTSTAASVSSGSAAAPSSSGNSSSSGSTNGNSSSNTPGVGSSSSSSSANVSSSCSSGSNGDSGGIRAVTAHGCADVGPGDRSCNPCQSAADCSGSNVAVPGDGARVVPQSPKDATQHDAEAKAQPLDAIPEPSSSVLPVHATPAAQPATTSAPSLEIEQQQQQQHQQQQSAAASSTGESRPPSRPGLADAVVRGSIRAQTSRNEVDRRQQRAGRHRSLLRQNTESALGTARRRGESDGVAARQGTAYSEPVSPTSSWSLASPVSPASSGASTTPGGPPSPAAAPASPTSSTGDRARRSPMRRAEGAASSASLLENRRSLRRAGTTPLGKTR